MYKLAIYEDNHSLRENILTFLKTYKQFEIVGEYANGSNAAQNTQSTQPQIAIVDIDMPETNGIECTKEIKRMNPATQILIHTVFEDDDNLFNALCAGANGYILKSATPDQLLAAIEDLISGGAPMSPSIARKVIAAFAQPQKTVQNYPLSVREKEILELLVKGYSYKMIANDCKITKETVKTHLKNIYSKLHVNSGTEAVAKAIRDQIV